jgi:hypothetical protein
MLIVETIRKIRLAAHRDGKSIREITRELRLLRNTVRKVLRSEQPRPKLGPYVEQLETLLIEGRPAPQTRTAHSRGALQGIAAPGL